MVSRSTLVLRSRVFLPLLAAVGCRNAGEPDLEGRAQVLMFADPSRSPLNWVTPVIRDGTLEDVLACTRSVFVERAGVGGPIYVKAHYRDRNRAFRSLEAWAEESGLDGKMVHVEVGMGLWATEKDAIRDEIVSVCRSRGSRGVVFEQSKAFLPQHFEVVKFGSP